LIVDFGVIWDLVLFQELSLIGLQNLTFFDELIALQVGSTYELRWYCLDGYCLYSLYFRVGILGCRNWLGSLSIYYLWRELLLDYLLGRGEVLIYLPIYCLFSQHWLRNLLDLSWLLDNLLHHLLHWLLLNLDWDWNLYLLHLLHLLYLYLYLLNLDRLLNNLLDWLTHDPFLVTEDVGSGCLLFYLSFLGWWFLWQMYKLTKK